LIAGFILPLVPSEIINGREKLISFVCELVLGKRADRSFNYRSYFNKIDLGINPDDRGNLKPRAKSTGLFILIHRLPLLFSP
jgi:hypothetical protein